MNLKIFLPADIFLEEQVEKVVAESPDGFFCLLSHHVDYVSAITTGILTYTPSGDGAGGDVYVALDEGALVKKGKEVLISTRRAVKDESLEKLHETVDKEFRNLDEREKKTKTTAAKIESNFVRRFLEIQTNE